MVWLFVFATILLRVEKKYSLSKLKITQTQLKQDLNKKSSRVEEYVN
jgi:hypothetical protein